ncbi:hypothetical protein EAO77_01050 [Streptomyces sp. t39]|nr:hypothetical protein EAO77_01050 [Streptomyces sp. t39]
MRTGPVAHGRRAGRPARPSAPPVRRPPGTARRRPPSPRPPARPPGTRLPGRPGSTTPRATHPRHR